MIKSRYKVIGVMSGTSLDGVDIVYVDFSLKSEWGFEILYAETFAYNSDWIIILKDLVSCSIQELKEIDKSYTLYLSKVIQDFIDKYNIVEIDAICTHGHTAMHQPENGFTYQIGNLPVLAKLLKQKVVCDFRVQDVALGGQGAPLVPIGDRLLFSDYQYCLNLGGFANISYEIDNERIAYDICPVNVVLNHYVRTIGFDFDDGGSVAAAGVINKSLLEKLNALRFYCEEPPKSLGLEWVKKEVLPLIDSYHLEVKDVLRTFVEHIAIQISSEINKTEISTVLVTGGGAYNKFLINLLKKYAIHNIITPSEQIVEFKEALIFAFLGVLKIENQVNCLKSVTGATKNHSSGEIYLP
ncbi:anhydro-N-acetylmuramic acid kinase [Gaetbulibacter saemankumensis]|uniref:anhydro-N-acetylmuramic acid kinase n=1 Tax=Gaetbulibacter saemankumensis TaxID=311208 RepID=UPI00041141AF|nr:anhydro-N-acetylmuramic acid kinase [Gaetbulibacter saemankumensis]